MPLSVVRLPPDDSQTISREFSFYGNIEVPRPGSRSFTVEIQCAAI
jgi:hypothetical protein